MAVPAFAPLPPANIRLSIGPEEWEACLEAWLTLSEYTLRLPNAAFNKTASDEGSLPAFLNSFYHELGNLQQTDAAFNGSAGISLRKVCFRLISRIFIENDAISQSLLRWDFLSDFCLAHVRSLALPRLMSKMWEKRTGLITPFLQKHKDLLVKTFESKQIDSAMSTLAQLGSIAHASPDIGSFFMTGSDFLDSLVGVYNHSTSDAERKALSTVTYLCLISLARTEIANTSLLSDHLYALKGQADKGDHAASLLADVVTNTPLIAKLRLSLDAKKPDRLSKLLDTLDTYRSPSIARRRKNTRPKQSKGKGKQNPTTEPANIHRLSLVTQIQDLFPDLGAGFILKLLDEYNDDVEQVTAHLLDDFLPPHLASLDRAEEAQIYDTDPQTQIDHLAPRSTPPQSKEPFIPERRNVFDDDELDRLEFSASRLHIGKQTRQLPTADSSNKAAILSALAAFDSDDDERDDTYDVEDVGGTVDTAHADGEPTPSARMTEQENEVVLFNAYKSNPELFGRTFNIRRGQARMQLKADTGMTDEGIEGWAIMLLREPNRLKRLEARSGVGGFDGRQVELGSTSYRESPGGTETEDSDAGRGGFRGRGRGRGRGGGSGGRGGNVAGAADDPGTANAQRRKEASKGSRANHNRRDQRAKKMARGGFVG